MPNHKILKGEPLSTAGKVIVVTGASSGMGKRMVKVPAQDGAQCGRLCQKDNIRCNAVAAGGFAPEIATSMGRPDMDGYAACGKVIALGKTGGPDDMARVIRFPADDASSFINGVVLPVDGGWTSF